MNYVRAQNLIDKGRGKAALRLGQPYNVYRIQNTAAVNVLDSANLLYSNVLILRRPDRSSRNVEGTLLTAIPWETVGDFRLFEVGDIFVQNDPVFGAGSTLVTYTTLEMDAFCLAFHGPVKKTMGIRLDRICQIFRPLQGGTDSNGFFSGDISESQPLQLSAGVFSFGTAGSSGAALIPVNQSSHIRARGNLFKDLPTSTGESVFMLYLPPLPGYEPREGDRVECQDGSRYTIHVPFEQEAGLVGNQVVCTRTVSRS